MASSHLRNWDYSWNAANFITICTKNREHLFASLPSPISPNRPPTKNKFEPQSRNLGSINCRIKIGITTLARSRDSNFAWYSRSHDHLLRNENPFFKISHYIKNNPINWQDDIFYNF
ncbi:hypothetical protein FHG64_12505 [Antarcticibacterium flavum]|uniref:Transposase n=1 Tax=Antarcticibacterium flavum TaxID=2058175 RepID=A0A5B7X9W7_9FLAO|nr:hypothetical protein [Antarcticibacterium sp. W02-3]QCY71433.1 hypothetical protein FHG64_12505 [Antarcticibacterium flavum]